REENNRRKRHNTPFLRTTVSRCSSIPLVTTPNSLANAAICVRKRRPLSTWFSCFCIVNNGPGKFRLRSAYARGVCNSAPKYEARKRRLCHNGASNNQEGTS